MPNSLIQIDNGLTGQSVVREMTNEEQEQLEAEIAIYQQQKEIKEQEKAEQAELEAEAAANKAALLNRLGITADEAKLLLS